MEDTIVLSEHTFEYKHVLYYAFASFEWAQYGRWAAFPVFAEEALEFWCLVLCIDDVFNREHSVTW